MLKILYIKYVIMYTDNIALKNKTNQTKNLEILLKKPPSFFGLF